jgi:hypothetical protein
MGTKLWDHWVMGPDGMPVNPKCEACNGHGVMEDGRFHYASVLMDCPKCCPQKEGN